MIGKMKNEGYMRVWTVRGALACILTFTILFLNAQVLSVDTVRAHFKAMLQRPGVDPRASFVSATTDSVLIEKGFFYSEATEKVPTLIYKPVSQGAQKKPVVICLHGTGSGKDSIAIRELLYRFSKLGFIAVAIDARFHGGRVKKENGHNLYNEAIIKAWKNKNSKGGGHPFYYDTVYDLWRLIDYLVTRPDVEPQRIGMIGISMGGIETWMASAVDERIKVIVPAISVQSFQWSLENDQWQGRARTIWAAHLQAARDLGDTAVNRTNVRIFWNKLLPGITDEFDCPSMIRLLAPRPLLILNTENDPNCPLQGARLAFDAATKEYLSRGALDKLKIDVEPNESHRLTARHMEMAIGWFKTWL